jgi:argininosuccinate synthase
LFKKNGPVSVTVKDKLQRSVFGLIAIEQSKAPDEWARVKSVIRENDEVRFEVQYFKAKLKIALVKQALIEALTLRRAKCKFLHFVGAH